MNFKEHYEREKAKPTPAEAWISRIAKKTHKKEVTIRMWLSGRQKPDELTLSILAKTLKTPADELFKENTTTQKQ